MLRTGIEKLASLEGEKHYVLCNRMGGEEITYNIKNSTFNINDRCLTEEDVDNDVGDNWFIYEIKDINGWKIREPIIFDISTDNMIEEYIKEKKNG